MTHASENTTSKNSPAVSRALARFWTRRAELARTPEEREDACKQALAALKEAENAK